MCGGAERQQPAPAPAPAPKPTENYTAPDLRSLYATFKETGTVPYSYYGQGAPTRDGEIEALKKSFPGAFTAPPARPAPRPQPAPQQPQRPTNPFTAWLMKFGNSVR